MAKSVVIEAQLGNINSAESSGKAYLFHSPHVESVRKGKKETYLGNAIKECSRLGCSMGIMSHPARNNIKKDIGGTVHNGTYGLREGEILKVFAQGKTGEWNSRLRTAVMYFQLRNSGPLNRISIKIPTGVEDAVLLTWDITGRYDILTMEEAEAVGVKILDNCRGQSSIANTEALFSFKRLENQLQPSPKLCVKVVDGKSVTIKPSKRSLEI